MLSFFTKKWKQAQEWIKTAAFPAIKTLIKKGSLEEPVYKILCVDDDRSFCQFMKRLAYSLGIQLDEAYSIEEAKRAIENYPNYQALIVDGHLPDGSGFQFVAWIREKKKLKTPVGFISRIYQDSKSFRLLKDGLAVDYVLEKPIRPSEVHQLLIKLCQIKPQPPEEEPFPDDLLADLKESYQKTISDKVERIEKLILAVQKDPSINHLQALKEEVHKISGSAGTYGYMAVSELCKNLELDLIEQIEFAKRGQLDHQWLFSLDEFFTQMKLHFQIEIVESDTQNAMRARHLPSVYIVDEDQAFLNSFAQPNQELRFDILTETRPERAIQTLLTADFYPQILLFSARYHSSVLTGYDLIKAFFQKNDYLTSLVAVMVEAQDLEDQIEALQKGMTFLLRKPLSVFFLLSLLDQTFFRPLPLPYKILVIDDDVDISQYILKTLKFSGLNAIALQNLQELEKTLPEYQPDLILLDVNLTDESGAGILEIIRKTLKYKKLLVAMLTVTQQDTFLIQKCYESDVDEILFKPLEGGILQRKVAYLLKKQTNDTLSVKQDAVTGLENRQTLKHYLQELQQRVSFPIQLVIFELEDFASISQKIKKEALTNISQALEDLLKKYDMAAYLGEGHFALVFQGYESHFIQLFMHAFLHRVHARLKDNVIQNKTFHLNEIIRTLTPESPVDDFLQQSEELLETLKKELPNQLVRLKSHPPFIGPHEVFIFHDELKSPDFLKTFFEKQPFKVTLFSKPEDVVPHSPVSLPLIILTDSWVGAKGLHLIKKFSSQHQFQVPLLYFSQLLEKEDLQRLLSEVHYFEAPFGMILIMASKLEESGDQKQETEDRARKNEKIEQDGQEKQDKKKETGWIGY